MARFFLDAGSWGEGAELRGDEAAHCARVLRARPGDEVEVFDGNGRSATARVRSVSKHAVALELGACREEPPPAVRILLCLAVLKGKAMDWIVPKAVELGASEIQPLRGGHTVAKPADRKEEKWRRAVLEACKQCGRDRLPVVHDAVDLGDFLATTPPADGNLIASLAPGARPLREAAEAFRGGGTVRYLVGPEGDFTEAERALALERGWRPVGLGPRVLRSETAALFGISLLVGLAEEGT